MTDKERLEEIKQIRNNMEEYMNPDGSVEDYPRYDELALFIIDDYLDYLIEQAERVQELESKLHHEELLKGIIENRSKTLNRYREAIEKAIEMISDSTGTITKPKEISLYDAWKIKDTLLEVLEESK